MILIPDGFSYTLLLSDFFAYSIPFITVAVLFCAYRVVTRAMR